MGVYRDSELADWSLTELRKHYPTARVQLISDGDDDKVWFSLMKKHQTELHFGIRLYETDRGGAMIHRMLKRWADNSTRYLIKIDSDTHVHRRFNWLPEGTKCLFGSHQHGSNFGTSLQGGCIGIGYDAAMDMYKRNLFLNVSLKNYRDTWATNETLIKRAESGLIAFEWVLCYVVKKKTDFPLLSCSEIMSRYRELVPNDDLKYAVTHPCAKKLSSLQSEPPSA